MVFIKLTIIILLCDITHKKNYVVTLSLYNILKQILMKSNVGSTDKIIRVILGLGIIGAGVYFKNWLGLIGLVPLLTAFMGFCPLYSLFGINSCKAPSVKK